MKDEINQTNEAVDESTEENLNVNLDEDLEKDFETKQETAINQRASEDVTEPVVEASKNKRNIKGILTEAVIYILIALICLLVIPKYVVQRTIVSGDSMQNTLMNNDNLIVEKLTYHFEDPKRFNVVVFYPYGKKEKEYYVKRVIGLPGETVQIKGKDIYINGKKLEEHYGKEPITYAGIAKKPLKLKADEFFLMGDNRDVSLDSRYEEVGPVHRDLIAGQAVLRIWPLSKFGTFK
jgi:signal peptidase I, bacterial type